MEVVAGDLTGMRGRVDRIDEEVRTLKLYSSCVSLSKHALQYILSVTDL